MTPGGSGSQKAAGKEVSRGKGTKMRCLGLSQGQKPQAPSSDGHRSAWLPLARPSSGTGLGEAQRPSTQKSAPWRESSEVAIMAHVRLHVLDMPGGMLR